jgi:hypothetical protein
VISLNGEIAGNLDRLSRQLVTARYDDETWVLQTESVLAAMKEDARQAREMRAPGVLQAAHKAWMEGIEAYDGAATLMGQAIKGPDEGLMMGATQRLEEASRKMQLATVMLERMMTK